MDNVSEAIIDLIFQLTGIKVSSSEAILDNGVMSSMMIIELIVLIEDRFNIHINPFELNVENFNKIESISEIVRKSLLDNS